MSENGDASEKGRDIARAWWANADRRANSSTADVGCYASEGSDLDHAVDQVRSEISAVEVYEREPGVPEPITMVNTPIIQLMPPGSSNEAKIMALTDFLGLRVELLEKIFSRPIDRAELGSLFRTDRELYEEIGKANAMHVSQNPSLIENLPQEKCDRIKGAILQRRAAAVLINEKRVALTTAFDITNPEVLLATGRRLRAVS